MKKNSIKKFFPVVFLTSAAFSGMAQKAADFKKSGDHYFTEGNYYSAAYYYQQYLEGGKETTGNTFRAYSVTLHGKASNEKGSATSNDPQIVYRLAESYRLINDYKDAEKYYEQLVQLKNDQFPDATYWYAVSLRANGKYQEAKERFQEYLRIAGGQGKYAQQARLELKNLTFSQEQQNRTEAKQFSVQKLENGINTAETNYAAAWDGNALVFTSTRPGQETEQKNSNALYKTETNGSVQKISIPQSAGTEQGIAALSPDGNRLYLTRWTKERGETNAAIYTSEKTNGNWSEPVKLNSAVNVDGSYAKQPFVTADGQYLIFSSNRPGGLGKYDLWAAPLSATGEAGTAFNLGAAINTTEDDETPFYHQPSQTLVFASRGRVGMGGFDLYQSHGTLSGKWTEAENLGYPVNSQKDDIYFTTNSQTDLLKNAVISSDRYSDYCLSLFKVDKQYKKFIAGTVVDCNTNQNLSDVQISFNGRSEVLRTNEKGMYLLEVDAFQPLTLTATKESYENGSLGFDRPQRSNADTLYNTVVCLKPVQKAEPPREQVLYFDFAKYDLRAETAVALDTLASLLNRESKLKLVVIGYTDKLGSDAYNLKLSQNRAQAAKDYLVAKGVAGERIEAIGKGTCCPVKPETAADGKDDPAARQANRRVQFELKFVQ